MGDFIRGEGASPMTPVVVVGQDRDLVIQVGAAFGESPEIEVVACIAPLSAAVAYVSENPPEVVVVATSSDDPRIWRGVMTMARPPLQLPILLVGPDAVQTSGFLTGAEDWIALDELTPLRAGRTVANALIRRRVAGGLPTQGHLHGLVTGLAHEVNNPLTVINADLEEAVERIEELLPDLDSDAADELADIGQMLKDDLEAAQRIGTLTRALQNMARMADTVPSALHAGPALRRVLERVAARYPRALATEIVGDVEVAVHASVHGFEEALYHVILNGMQAQDGAPVSIEIVTAHHQVDFHVRDRGCGVPADIVGREVKPFVTGRPAGEGLGLGLTLAAVALRRAGGDVIIQPREGGGTEVCLMFVPARARMPLLDDEDDDV